jgi:probable phosphoglycerate mutase
LAGLNGTIDRDLVEWDYGQYEGLRTIDIQKKQPNWQLFRDGCPDGETLEQIGDRADHVVQRIRAIDGNVLLVSSGHFLRVFVARWLGLPTSAGACFLLSTASVSILGYEHDRSEPVVKLWNDTHHLSNP